MTKRKAVKTSVFAVGREAAASLQTSGGAGFVSIKDGESISFAPLHGLGSMVSALMHEYWDVRPAVYHPCFGTPDCPGCQLGNEARFKGFLPVLTRAGEVMIWPFKISVYNVLETMEDELVADDPDNEDPLRGYALTFSRKGSGLNTKYSVTGVGRRVDVSAYEAPDFIERLGPQTIEEARAALLQAGVLSGSEDKWGDV